MLWNAGVLLVLLRFHRYLARDGYTFLGYLSLYAVGRFILTFVRQESIWFWGLQEAQVVSVLILVVSAALFLYLRKRDLPNQLGIG